MTECAATPAPAAHSSLLPTPAAVAWAVDAAAGRRPGSLLLRNARLVNVFTQEILPVHILIAGKLVAAVLPTGDDDARRPAAGGTGEFAGYVRNAGAAAQIAAEVLDLQGQYVIPGLMDAHVHLESSLVSPAEYARAVVPRGVTTVVCDPHEIANVAGMAGIRYLLDATADLPLDVLFTASSCVPATELETAGARLDTVEIAELLSHPRVVGVAELMNFPAVIDGAEGELAKAALAAQTGKVADGHAPQVMGRDLQAYAAAGIRSDHEATTAAEGLARLRAGLYLMIREGSAAHNLSALLPLVTPETADRCLFCTDDRHPHDLLREGGVDLLVRRAIEWGLAPALAVRLASLNAARYFRLPRRGAVAPGTYADLAAVPDLRALYPSLVLKSGRIVARDGRLTDPTPTPAPSAQAAAVRDTMRLPPLQAADLALPATATGPVRLIRLLPGQILTAAATVEPTTLGGCIVADPERDIARLLCVDRYSGRGRIGRGLVQGFGLRRGALASTVAHDNHNLMAVGVDDTDLLIALRRAAALGGGFVVVAGGEVLAEVPLPIAGLMSDAGLEAVAGQVDTATAAARALGATGHSPFMTLSFLALAVIPELRLTDHGLVDVKQGRLVPLAAAER